MSEGIFGNTNQEEASSENIKHLANVLSENTQWPKENSALERIMAGDYTPKQLLDCLDTISDEDARKIRDQIQEVIQKEETEPSGSQKIIETKKLATSLINKIVSAAMDKKLGLQ